MEWTEGRKLASVTYNNKETAFEYNHEGLRIKKTLHDGSYIFYEIVDGVYVGETRYNTNGSVAVYIRYILDEGNSPVGISLWYPATGSWTDYHFVKNLQGDVLEVYKVSDGSLAASYTYDSWGNILSQSGDLATLNPFRYRSYYYDTQTWFYYLQSRYYDPAIGRFLNADSYASTGQGLLGYNMFAYCNNNPILFFDSTGCAAWGINTVAICDGGCGSLDSPYYWNDPSHPYAAEVQDFIEKESMKRILDGNKIGKYKDTLVINMPLMDTSAFSYGIIFIGRNINYDSAGIATLKHEYGHYIQYSELGAVDYSAKIIYPSAKGFWSGVPYDVYYSQPWEYLADLFGGVERNGYTYAPDAHQNALVFWDSIT